MYRIELCTEYLDPETREEILEAIYDELRISPGMVSANGEFELQVRGCREADAENAPYLKINDALFARVSAKRVRELIQARKR